MNYSLFDYAEDIPYFLTDVIIPFILGVAFLIVVINLIRYFVIDGKSEDGQKAAKSQALYSIAAFVTIFIFWGIVVLLVDSFGFADYNPPCPDYIRSQPGNLCATYGRPASLVPPAPIGGGTIY